MRVGNITGEKPQGKAITLSQKQLFGKLHLAERALGG